MSENDSGLPLTMDLNKADTELMLAVVKQGIDARLEALKDTVFAGNTPDNKIRCIVFSYDDVQVIVRRLLEMDVWGAESFADAIIYVVYGCEAF